MFSEIAQLLSTVPAGVSMAISLDTIALVWYLNYKKVTVESEDTGSNIHQRQVSSLLAQVELLSKELNQAREQLTEIHEQNIQLMEQLRIANRRISELETLIDNRTLI